MRQQSIEIEGVAHNAPIPMACRVGPVMASSGISGIDPKTGKPADGADQQAYHAFENLKSVLKKAGLDLGDVVKMTVFLTDDNNRAAINKYWNECWPDPHKRPARHSLVLPLRGGVLLQLEVLAVAKDAK